MNLKLGGRRGYVGGSTILPWYIPRANGPSSVAFGFVLLPGGPRNVKCHSKRLSSCGVAVKSGEGELANSAASLTNHCQ